MNKQQKGERKIVTKLLYDCIAKYKRNFDGRLAILFSGGKDSTLIALATADAYPNAEIHLICMDNGVSYYLNTAKRQANLIQKIFPKTKIIFELINIKRSMKEKVIFNIEKNFLQDKFSSLLVCIGCKYIMHSNLAQYALNNNIGIVLDGFASRQSNYPEQTKEFMDNIKEEYNKINLQYESPIYNYFQNGDHITKVIFEYKIPFVEQQPICIFGGSYSLAKPTEIKKYVKYFKQKNKFTF